MKIKNLFYQIAPPCAKCPYTLGLIYTTASICPQCRLDGYRAYERFKRLAAEAVQPKNDV